jgi:hypothetical protein
MMRTEGIQFLLELANALQSRPANYYIGLCEESEDVISKAASLFDLTELSGNGYSRQALTADSADMVSAAGGSYGRKLTTAEVTFTASGGNWNTARTRFLATSSDNSGKLIATEPVNSGGGVALGDGESYDCNMTILGEPEAT